MEKSWGSCFKEAAPGAGVQRFGSAFCRERSHQPFLSPRAMAGGGAVLPASTRHPEEPAAKALRKGKHWGGRSGVAPRMQMEVQEQRRTCRDIRDLLGHPPGDLLGLKSEEHVTQGLQCRWSCMAGDAPSSSMGSMGLPVPALPVPRTAALAAAPLPFCGFAVAQGSLWHSSCHASVALPVPARLLGASGVGTW